MYWWRNFIFKNPKLIGWLAYLCAVLPPLLLVTAWHITNTRLPNDDGANYLQTSLWNYQAYATDGFEEGIRSAYYTRGWRPIFFPVLALPFMIATEGDLRVSSSLPVVIFYFISISYSFCLLRETLPMLQAVAATLLVSTLSWMLQHSYIFFSEIVMIAAAMGFLYHLGKTDYLQSARHAIAAGLWLSLGLVIRPVENVMTFAILVVVFLYLAYRKETLSRNDILVSVVAVGGAVAVLALKIQTPLPAGADLVTLCGIVIVFAGVWLFRKRLNLSAAYAVLWFIPAVLAFIWWYPGIEELYSWIYDTSFGHMAQVQEGAGDLNLLTAVVRFGVRLGGFPLLAVIIAAGIGIISVRHQDETKKLLKRLSPYLLIGLSAVAVPVFIIALSPTSDYRRAFIGFLILFIGALTVALHPRWTKPGMRLVIVLVVVCIQFYIALEPILVGEPILSDKLIVFREVGVPVRGGDPSQELFESGIFDELIPESSVCIFTLSVDDLEDKPFDSYILGVLAQRDGASIIFTRPWDFQSVDNAYELIWRTCRYLLLDVTTSETFHPWSMENPYSQFTLDLIRRWEEADLDEKSLQQVREAAVNGTHFVLLQNMTVPPILIETYNGFNLVVYGTHYYALSESADNVNLVELDDAAIVELQNANQLFIADSLADLKAQVDSKLETETPSP